MSHTFDAGDLLSTKETARLLGVQPNTLEIWRVQGKGPPFLKLGDQQRSAVRYLRAALVAWAAKRAYNSTSAYTAQRRLQYSVVLAETDVFCATHLPASSKPSGATE